MLFAGDSTNTSAAYFHNADPSIVSLSFFHRKKLKLTKVIVPSYPAPTKSQVPLPGPYDSKARFSQRCLQAEGRGQGKREVKEVKESYLGKAKAVRGEEMRSGGAVRNCGGMTSSRCLPLLAASTQDAPAFPGQILEKVGGGPKQIGCVKFASAFKGRA